MNMKSNNSYGIFYLLIVFFVIMIFVPPLLRIVLPNEEIENNTHIEDKKEEQIISRKLNCEFNQNIGEKFIKLNTSTDYNNNEITSIIFTYDISTVQDTGLLSSFAIFTELNELKNISGVEYNQNGTEESILINSNSIISNEPRLQKYSQNIDVQKAYYEQLGLICNVVK